MFLILTMFSLHHLFHFFDSALLCTERIIAVDPCGPLALLFLLMAKNMRGILYSSLSSRLHRQYNRLLQTALMPG